MGLTTVEHARELDQANPLKAFKGRFENPVVEGTREDVLYLVNHSLGRRPSELPHHQEFHQRWREKAVGGHFGPLEEGSWYQYDEKLRPALRALMGAQKDTEVAMRGGDLSTNMGLLMRPMYKPDKEARRFGLLALGDDFHSDVELVQSMIEEERAERRRFDAPPLPKEALRLLTPPEGSLVIPDAAIIAAIEEMRGELALVHIPEVHFFTGYRYDTNAIAEAAHAHGAKVMVDAAHAFGNVSMQFDADNGPDAVVACTYKYGAAGPGNEAAVYVPERHHQWLHTNGTALRGWFSFRAQDRFSSAQEKQLADGPSSLRMGNTTMASASILLDAIQLIDEASIQQIEEVAHKMTGYFIEMMEGIDPEKVQMVTPADTRKRGAMLTFTFREDTVARVKQALEQHHVEVDWRDKPGQASVMRVSFAPLHNSFEDVWRFANILRGAIDHD